MRYVTAVSYTHLEDGESVDKINYVEEKVYTQKNVLSVLGDRVY